MHVFIPVTCVNIAKKEDQNEEMGKDEYGFGKEWNQQTVNSGREGIDRKRAYVARQVIHALSVTCIYITLVTENKFTCVLRYYKVLQLHSRPVPHKSFITSLFMITR